MLRKLKVKIFNFGVRMMKTALFEAELERASRKQVELKQIAKVIAGNIYSPENLRKDLRYFEGKSESVRDWWERAHTGQNKFWLTGSSGKKVWKNLNIYDRIKPGATVLNIGVGTGRCTRELAKQGLVVHALDISQNALDSVKDIAVCWTPNKLKDLPKNFFDIAISHLVAQHMSDADLIKQIRAVCRSLKPTGVFAIQFAQHINNNSVHDQSLANIKSGGVLRTNKEFAGIVKQAGGKILRSWIGTIFEENSTHWVYAHIVKLKGTK